MHLQLKVLSFASDFGKFVEEGDRFNTLATNPSPGSPIDERAVIQLPVDDARFSDKMKALLAAPELIALMDSYFDAKVELDAATVIRNHGCNMGLINTTS